MFDLSQNWQSENLEVIAFSTTFRDRESNRLIQEDIKKVGFVLIACLIYTMIHLKSIFLGLISLFNMFMTVPITMLIYKKILQISYFSSIHLSIVIIIVGIGCDDIFIFHE